MLTEKQVFEIKILYREGLSKLAIARRLGIAPNTVNKYLKKEWCQMAKRGSKLDPFKDYIKKRLEEYPELTATVLFKELVEKGYSGKLTILRMYVATIRPKEKPEIVVRFETKPGKQFQVDWGTGTTIIAGEKATVKFFIMVLGYSRMLYVETVPDEKLETLIQAHLHAFEYFGGYPSEGLYDNMKTVVKKLQKHKEYNAKFMDFADFYGLKVITHRPYNPKAKGKVERMVPYVRENILYGQSYSSQTELKNVLRDWLAIANQRLHSELKETPLERFEREKDHLNKLSKLYPIRRLNTRLVRDKGQIVYEERAYRVGKKYVGERVNLQVEGSLLKIYDGDELITVHPLKDQVEKRSLREYQALMGDAV